MRSGHPVTAIAPVVAAGVGVRFGRAWLIRLASLRLAASELGSGAIGIVTRRPAESQTVIDLLSGQRAPTYGTLRVLGHDMSTSQGRAAVRRQIGISSRGGWTRPGIKIRGLVERAARQSGARKSDRHLLVAAILDRMALAAWAAVPLRAAPELVARKARLAAACVHQPKLLLIDGLLDQLSTLDQTVLADLIRDLERDTAVVAIGHDADALALVSDQVLTLSAGILIDRTPPAEVPGQLTIGRDAQVHPRSGA